MGEALLWGLVAGSSLILGGLLTFWLRPGHRAVGLLMGFGSGTLISAVSYELVADAFETSKGTGLWIGLAAGALVYYFGDREIARRGGAGRKSSRSVADNSTQKAIVLGTVLDGIPEGIVLGMSFIGGGGGSVAVIGAVFVSNLPEAIGASAGLERSMGQRRVLAMWAAIALATGLAALVGFGLFDTASAGLIAFTKAFAGGALLTMVASTMLPEAAKEGGDQSGLATVLGFAVAFALTQLA